MRRKSKDLKIADKRRRKRKAAACKKNHGWFKKLYVTSGDAIHHGVKKPAECNSCHRYYKP